MTIELGAWPRRKPAGEDGGADWSEPLGAGDAGDSRSLRGLVRVLPPLGQHLTQTQLQNGENPFLWFQALSLWSLLQWPQQMDTST